MKITRFDDHGAVTDLISDLNAALQGVAEKHQIEIKLGHPKQRITSVEISIHAHVIADGQDE